MWRNRSNPRGLRRTAARLKPRRRLLILCEGEVTEPNYFLSMRREVRNLLVEIEVIPKCGVPKTVVEEGADRKKKAQRAARRAGDSFLSYDEVWCVFDVDDHPRLNDALQQARDNKLQLAVSNPNFELWILLHFQDQFAHEPRAQIARSLRRHLPEYVKNVPYDAIRPFYQLAVARAQRLEEMHQRNDTVGGNPSTGVYRLTEGIFRSK
jgi:hypothetical protein